MQNFTSYACGFCGEANDANVDVAAGMSQSYVEDCTVCCRPNVLTIAYDPDSETLTVSAVFEG